jgi:hypothetical protein
VWVEKANVSEPLMTCRNAFDGIETGLGRPARDESGGCLLIGQAVSGMNVARARPGLWCGTWEPVVLRLRAASGAVVACGRLVGPLLFVAGVGVLLDRVEGLDSEVPVGAVEPDSFAGSFDVPAAFLVAADVDDGVRLAGDDPTQVQLQDCVEPRRGIRGELDLNRDRA